MEGGHYLGEPPAVKKVDIIWGSLQLLGWMIINYLGERPAVGMDEHYLGEPPTIGMGGHGSMKGREYVTTVWLNAAC